MSREPRTGRRTFLRTAALASAAALPRPRATAAAAGPLGRHRALYNGDCNFLFYNPEIWQPEGGPFSLRAIERHLAAIARGGIDTLLINPNTQVAWYPARGLPSILDAYTRGDLGFARRVTAGLAHLKGELAEAYARDLVALLDRYLDLAAAGIDWLAACARLARAGGISPWLSYRMNATHFSAAPDAPVNAPVFRDPANRLPGRVPGGGGAVDTAWIGLNYGRPVVREHMAALIRDGVERYDYEGLELDWLRHPLCLEGPASARATAEITEWIGTLRAITLRRRPDYRLTIRAPANLAYLRGIGLDLRALAQRGLIDGVACSNFWQNPWELPVDDLRRELGDRIAILGGIENAPNWLEAAAPSLVRRPVGPDVQLAGDNAFHASHATAAAPRVRGTRYLSASPEMLRAAAAGRLVLGADGVECFNFFVTDQVRVPGMRAEHDALRGIASLDALRGRTKHYSLSTASLQGTRLWDVPEQLPVSIPPRHRRALRLPMCAEPPGTKLRLVVQIVTDASSRGAACGISVNGAEPAFDGIPTGALLFPTGPYTIHVEEHRAWNFPRDPASLRDGWNEIVLYHEGEGELRVVSVEVGLLPGP